MHFKPKHLELRKLMALALAGSLGAAAPSALAFPFFPIENTEDDLDGLDTDPDGGGGFTFGLELPNAFDPVTITFEFNPTEARFYFEDSGFLFPAKDPDLVDAMVIEGQVTSRAYETSSGTPVALTADDAQWDLRIFVDDGVFWNADEGYFGVNSPNAGGTNAGSLDVSNSRIRYLPPNSTVFPNTNPDLSYTPNFDETSCVRDPTPIPTFTTTQGRVGLIPNSGDAGFAGACDIRIGLRTDLDPGELALQFFPNFAQEVMVVDGGEQQGGFFPQGFAAPAVDPDPDGGVLVGVGLTTGDCDPTDPNNFAVPNDPTTNLCAGAYNTLPEVVNAAPNRQGGSLQAVGTPLAVDEPAALGLASLGALAVVALRRRRRRWS